MKHKSTTEICFYVSPWSGSPTVKVRTCRLSSNNIFRIALLLLLLLWLSLLLLLSILISHAYHSIFLSHVTMSHTAAPALLCPPDPSPCHESQLSFPFVAAAVVVVVVVTFALPGEIYGINLYANTLSRRDRETMRGGEKGGEK